MRVLLYVEPHPIRDTLTHFADIVREFLPLLSSAPGFDIRLFANEATFTHLGKTHLSPHDNRLIHTTRDEEALFSQYQKLPWETEGLPVWLKLMSGKGKVSERQLDLLRRIWNIFPFEIIVHWGENGAVTRFLEERPVTRVAMELGCTRPPFLNSVVMDPYGTNGAGVVPKLTIEDLRGIVDNQSMSRHEALFGFSQSIAAPGYAQQFQPLPGELDARWMNQKAAFLPLQLFDDANLLRFSPYNTVSDVVLDVVPKLAEAGYMTIIKPHPASKFRKGSLYANSFARRALHPWSDRIIWCDDSTPLANSRLFNLADIVVTVNSSVGFEALYYDKPVVVLGDAVYKPKDMFPTLDDVLSGSFDRDAYLDAAGILRNFMLGGYLQPEAIRRDPSGFGCRLSLIRQLQQIGGGDPVKFASGYWKACAPAHKSLASSAVFWGLSVPNQAEFGVPAIPPKSPPAAAQTAAPKEPRARATLGYRPIVRRLRQHLAIKSIQATTEWLDAMWSTEQGRAEVIKIGRLVDPDYYTATNRDVAEARITPVEHFLHRGFAEGRTPAPSIPAATAMQTLSHLKRAAEIMANGRSADFGTTPDDAIAENYLPMFRRLVAHVRADSNDAFLSWLDTLWNTPTGRSRIIELGGFVDPEYYLATYGDVRAAGVDPVRHYCNAGILEGRSPRKSLRAVKAGVVWENLRQAASADALALAEFPFAEDVEARRQAQLHAAFAGTGNRIAVVAHLYYTDLVPEILEHLKAIREPFDLIVTMPDWGTRRIVEMVRAAHPDALFYAAPNRGRDIGPFIDLLPAMLEKDYDAVLKLQTKRGYFRADRMIPEFGEMWREETFSALLGSPERVTEILDAFRSRKQLNMVGPEPFLLSLDKYPYHDNGALAECLLDDIGAKDGAFYAGTMFWVRPSCLQPLAELKLTHFAPESGANDGALAHLVERLFGQAAGIGTDALASAPVDPGQPLDFAPEPATITVDAYFTERQKELRNRKTKDGQGALIW